VMAGCGGGNPLEGHWSAYWTSQDNTSQLAISFALEDCADRACEGTGRVARADAAPGDPTCTAAVTCHLRKSGGDVTGCSALELDVIHDSESCQETTLNWSCALDPSKGDELDCAPIDVCNDCLFVNCPADCDALSFTRSRT
jgi:hypothetical protein